MRRATSAALLALLLSACALLGKGKPLTLRYFDLDADPAYQPPAQVPEARLKLGSVAAARHIDRRFVTRSGPHELSYHEGWRFSDAPDAFLRRMLDRNLFERAGVTRAVSGRAPTLELELVAFEEVQGKGASRAHVAVVALMHDDRLQLWQRTFREEREVASGEHAAALAEALSQGLAKVAGEITALTLATLAEAKQAELKAPQPAPPAE